MRTIWAGIGCLVVLGAGVSGVRGEVYYVAPDGAAGAAGTMAAPWGTLQQAATTLQPGDTVIMRPGHYYLGPEGFTSTVSGRPGAPITFRAEKTGQARLTVSREITNWTAAPRQCYATPCPGPPAFMIHNDDPLSPAPPDTNLQPGQWRWAAGRLTVRLWDDRAPDGQSIRAGGETIIRLGEGASYQVWEGFRLEYGGCGWDATAPGAMHNTLRDCILWGTGTGARGGAGALLEHNYCYSIGSGNEGHGLQVTGPGATVRYNRCNRVAGCAIRLHTEARGTVVEGNELQDPREQRRSDRSRTVALLVGGAGHHHLSRNLVIGPHQIAVHLTSPGNLLANNTLIGAVQVAVKADQGQAGNQLRNNALHSAGTLLETGEPLTADYSLYLGEPSWLWLGRPATSLTAWRQLSGQDAHSSWQQQSPFANRERRNYTPAAGQGLVDRGLEVPGLTEGFAGKAPDIGAFELGGPPRPTAGPRR